MSTHGEAISGLVESDVDSSLLSLPEGPGLHNEQLVNVLHKGQLKGCDGVFGDAPRDVLCIEDDCEPQSLY